MYGQGHLRALLGDLLISRSKHEDKLHSPTTKLKTESDRIVKPLSKFLVNQFDLEIHQSQVIIDHPQQLFWDDLLEFMAVS